MPNKITDFARELEFTDDGRLITAHYAIANGKKIRITSKCDYDCPTEHRMFNGRDCPSRVRCTAANTDGHTLSKNEVGMMSMQSQKIARSVIDDLDRLLENQH